MSDIVAGWYPDPTNPEIERQWDGAQWTPLTRPSVKKTTTATTQRPVAIDQNSRVVLSWAVLLGGVLVATGTLLGWMDATTGFVSITRNAFQLGSGESMTIDGPIALGLGIILIGIGIARLTRSAMPRYIQRSPIVVALGACVLVGLDYRSIHNWVLQVSSSNVIASIGIGYWICCAGAVVALLAGLGLMQADRS